MKIGNIEVKHVAEGNITILQEGEHESRCHVSKATDAHVHGESIKGDYLHMLAGVLANMRNLTKKEILQCAADAGLFRGLLPEEKKQREEAVFSFALAVIGTTLGVIHG